MNVVGKLHPLRTFLLFTLLTVSTACDTSYWWSRGQTPSSTTLVSRAKSRLDESLQHNSESRREIVPPIQGIMQELTAAVSSAELQRSADTKQHLDRTKDSFVALEGKLSVGSRAAYGELSGQLRTLIAESSGEQPVDVGVVGLFAARTFFFLASELTVPAPTFG